MHDYFSIKVLSIRQCWIWFLLEYYDLMQHALQEIVDIFSKMIIFEFEVLSSELAIGCLYTSVQKTGCVF